jgi:hypothetical protein
MRKRPEIRSAIADFTDHEHYRPRQAARLELFVNKKNRFTGRPKRGGVRTTPVRHARLPQPVTFASFCSERSGRGIG